MVVDVVANDGEQWVVVANSGQIVGHGQQS